MARSPRYEEIIICHGAHFRAEWYITREGRMPALEYYDALGETDQERFDSLIRYLCDAKPGTRLPKTIFQIEDHPNRIYALKTRDERFFNFMTVDATIIVTNAYHKHPQQMTKADLSCLQAAVHAKADYLARIKDGTYYET